MEYKGSWKYKKFCSRCGKYEAHSGKWAVVCIKCSSWNKRELTKKKEHILRVFKKKYKLPLCYPLSYPQLKKGKILYRKDVGAATKERIIWLMNKKKDKLKALAKELLRLENQWRKTKHLKPLKKLGYK